MDTKHPQQILKTGPTTRAPGRRRCHSAVCAAAVTHVLSDSFARREEEEHAAASGEGGMTVAVSAPISMAYVES